MENNDLFMSLVKQIIQNNDRSAIYYIDIIEYAIDKMIDFNKLSIEPTIKDYFNWFLAIYELKTDYKRSLCCNGNHYVVSGGCVEVSYKPTIIPKYTSKDICQHILDNRLYDNDEYVDRLLLFRSKMQFLEWCEKVGVPVNISFGPI
jgi:hypothetical protein